MEVYSDPQLTIELVLLIFDPEECYVVSGHKRLHLVTTKFMDIPHSGYEFTALRVNPNKGWFGKQPDERIYTTTDPIITKFLGSNKFTITSDPNFRN
jgi:hypothetical protein